MTPTETVRPAGTIARSLARSSVGRKYLMAITGLLAFGFVFGHMAGNLQIFLGQDQINSYAEKLQGLGPLLWGLRIGLVVVFGLHIWLGIQLKAENTAARPIPYQRPDTVQASLASRTMIWSGLVVLSFIIYHLLHFTALVLHPEYQTLVDAQGRPDVFGRMVIGFSNPLISGFYLLSVGLLSFHISHGVASMLQSLGWSSPERWPAFKRAAALFALIIFLGFASVPISVLTGIVSLPGSH